MGFSTIDIIFVSVILILVVRCTLRGFVEEFMSVAAITLGLIVAFLLYPQGAIYVKTKLNIQVLPEALAFGALFLGVFILVKIFEHILRDIVQRVQLGSLDRFLGILWGSVEGLLVVALAIFVLSVQPLFDASSLLDKSLFAHYLLPLIGSLEKNTPIGNLRVPK
jgi:membrane protein required for colicin V production